MKLPFTPHSDLQLPYSLAVMLCAVLCAVLGTGCSSMPDKAPSTSDIREESASEIRDISTNEERSAEQSIAWQPKRRDGCVKLHHKAELAKAAYDLQAAEQLYLLCLEKDPHFRPALVNLGILNELYFRRVDQALHFYRRAQVLQTPVLQTQAPESADQQEPTDHPVVDERTLQLAGWVTYLEEQSSAVAER